MSEEKNEKSEQYQDQIRYRDAARETLVSFIYATLIHPDRELMVKNCKERHEESYRRFLGYIARHLEELQKAEAVTDEQEAFLQKLFRIMEILMTNPETVLDCEEGKKIFQLVNTIISTGNQPRQIQALRKAVVPLLRNSEPARQHLSEDMKIVDVLCDKIQEGDESLMSQLLPFLQDLSIIFPELVHSKIQGALLSNIVEKAADPDVIRLAQELIQKFSG